MGGRGQSSTSYRGSSGAHDAVSHGAVSELVDRLFAEVENYPKLADGASETISQLEAVKAGADRVKVYRAAPSDRINNGDWVFMSREQADSFSRNRFTREVKPGYNVIEMEVPAAQVGWTGKNLEFVYTGRSRKGGV